MMQFDHPVQCAAVVAAAHHMATSVITRAYQRGALGNAAYLSGRIVLVDTSQQQWLQWLEGYTQNVLHRKLISETSRHRRKNRC